MDKQNIINDENFKDEQREGKEDINKSKNTKQAVSKTACFKTALKTSSPVFFGYFSASIAFGMLASTAGYPVWITVLYSIFIFAGSGQFLGLQMIARSAGFIEIFILTVAINIRHIAYGIAKLKDYENDGILKGYNIFGLTDETFAVLSASDVGEIGKEKWYHFFVTILNHSYWVFGTLLGAAAGNIIKFDTTGMDFALTALFLVIFFEQWEGSENHIPAVTGILCGLIALIVFGPANMIFPALLLITIVLLSLKKRISGGEEQDG